MIELEVLSGKLAGKVYHARQFPFVIGRSHTASLQSEDNGLWDQHATIDLVPAEGFVLAVRAGAPATVNGQPVVRTRLRPGDVVQCGACKFRFWLGPAPQSSTRKTELMTWFLLASVLAVQLWLISLLQD